jgi:hypothetical protein
MAAEVTATQGTLYAAGGALELLGIALLASPDEVRRGGSQLRNTRFLDSRYDEL